ncbi:MAG: MFS transporter [Lachnospiraceae bacterium]|nr:MFS transporter [Lachnospiraceae bacterium]
MREEVKYKKVHRHGTMHYSVIHGFFWIAYCAGTGYSSTYLLGIGFRNSQIGLLIALSGLLAALLQPALAGRIDRSGKMLLKPVIAGGITAAVFLSLAILFLPDGAGLISGICFAGNLTVMQLLVPLINSLSVCGRESSRINFGFARAIGSLTYAAASYVLGKTLAEQGMDVLSVVRIAAFAMLLLAVLLFPVQRTDPEVCSSREQNGFFDRYPGFGILMAGCFFLYLCHSLLTYYNYQIVLDKGGDEGAYGMVIALAAMLELPVMFGFSAMLRKASAGFWFLTAGFGYIAKASGALLAVTMTAYYGIQIFQMFSWSMISVASVSYVKEITASEDSTRAQAFVTLSYTAAMACGSLSGGFLLQLMDVRTMLILAAVLAVSGTAVLRRGLRKLNQGLTFAK